MSLFFFKYKIGATPRPQSQILVSKGQYCNVSNLQGMLKQATISKQNQIRKLHHFFLNKHAASFHHTNVHMRMLHGNYKKLAIISNERIQDSV